MLSHITYSGSEYSSINVSALMKREDIASCFTFRVVSFVNFRRILGHHEGTQAFLSENPIKDMKVGFNVWLLTAKALTNEGVVVMFRPTAKHIHEVCYKDSTSSPKTTYYVTQPKKIHHTLKELRRLRP